jgi:hypothetical protein
MGSKIALKLVVLLIVGLPAFYYGLKFTLLFAYQGIVQRKMGSLVGYPAVFVGIYSLAWAVAFAYAAGYIIVWLFF